MRNGWRIFSVLFLGLLVVEILILAPREEGAREGEATRKEVQPQGEHEQILKGVHLVETKDGRKEWELDALDATGYKDKGDWILSRVRARFFTAKGDNSFSVEGARGVVSPKTRDMKISGSVIVTSANGYRLDTYSVTYKSKTETLESDDPVVMVDTREQKKSRLEVRGVGFLGSVPEGYMDVLKNATVKKGLSDGRIVNVKSNRARFSGTDRSANFSGEVEVDVGSSRVTGPEARFLYDGQKQVIRSLEVDGGVRLSDLDKWATARRFTMSFADDKYVLNGAPRLVQNSDELKGEEIVLIEGGKRIQVRRAKALMDSSRPEDN